MLLGLLAMAVVVVLALLFALLLLVQVGRVGLAAIGLFGVVAEPLALLGFRGLLLQVVLTCCLFDAQGAGAECDWDSLERNLREEYHLQPVDESEIKARMKVKIHQLLGHWV